MFVAARIVMDAAYYIEYPERNEYMCLFSSEGNEDYWEEYLKYNDIGDSVRAIAHISGHWFKPLYS